MPTFNFPITLRLLGRRLRSNVGPTSLTVFAICISVALATGLEMSSRSAQLQIERTVEALVGSSKIEVTAGKTGLPERLLEVVRATPGVVAASPIVEARFRLKEHAFPLSMIGIDLLAERQIRKNSITKHGVQIRDPLHLLAELESVIVTEPLLERLGLTSQWENRDKTTFDAHADGKNYTFIVQATLESGGLGDAYGGHVVLMDVYSLQTLMGRVGWLDRIDVVPEKEESVPDLIARLQQQLGGFATIKRSSVRTELVDDTLEMLRIAVLMLAGVGVLAACLVSYAALALSVERQQKYLGALRAAGMEATRVRRGVYLESAVLACAGTLLGFLLGVALSAPLLSMLSVFTSKFAAREITNLEITIPTIAVAIGVGVLIALVGAVGPARRAAGRFPLDSADEMTGSKEGKFSGSSVLWVFAGLLVLLRVFDIDLGLSPVLSVIATYGAGLVFLLACAPLYPKLLGGLSRVVRPVIPAMGYFLGRYVGSRPRSLAITVASIGAVVGALSGVLLLVESVATTLDDWTASRYPDAVLITAGSYVNDVERRELLVPEVMAEIRQSPGVKAVDEQYWFRPTIMYQGKEVSLTAYSMDVVAQFGFLPTVGRPSSDVARAVAAGDIAVSDGFSRYFAVNEGDSLTLDTPLGMKTFSVVGIVRDYRGASGTIFFDLDTYDKIWTRAGAWAAVIWTSGNRNEVLNGIRTLTGSKQDLYFHHGDDLLFLNRSWVHQFIGPIYVVAGLVAMLAGLAITILLIGTVAERRQEIALFRASGAEPLQMMWLVLADSSLVALIGSGLGLVLGLICVGPMIDVLREGYGSYIEQAWWTNELAFVVVGAVIAGFVGALVPARMAFVTEPTQLFTPE